MSKADLFERIEKFKDDNYLFELSDKQYAQFCSDLLEDLIPAYEGLGRDYEKIYADYTNLLNKT